MVKKALSVILAVTLVYLGLLGGIGSLVKIILGGSVVW